MRRLYVTNEATYLKHKNGFSKEITTYWMGLTDNTKPGWKEAWIAAGKPMVVTTEMGEVEQDKWEGHPGVTVLPHPSFQGSIQMKHVMAMDENVANHTDGIALLTAPANLGITTGHTVVDVHKLLSRWHTMFRLRMGAK
jgi:hypothetical protein